MSSNTQKIFLDLYSRVAQLLYSFSWPAITDATHLHEFTFHQPIFCLRTQECSEIYITFLRHTRAVFSVWSLFRLGKTQSHPPLDSVRVRFGISLSLSRCIDYSPAHCCITKGSKVRPNLLGSGVWGAQACLHVETIMRIITYQANSM